MGPLTTLFSTFCVTLNELTSCTLVSSYRKSVNNSLWKYKVKDAAESLGHIMKEPRSFLEPASTEEKCPAQSYGPFEEA